MSLGIESMAWCKTVVSPLLAYWRYHRFALTRRNVQIVRKLKEMLSHSIKAIGLFNTLSPRRNRSHFADDIFKCIFLNENVWIPIKISLKFVPRGPINNIPALIQIMACRLDGAKPLSESMMVSLSTHICVTRHQWVKQGWHRCSWSCSAYLNSRLVSRLAASLAERWCRQVSMGGNWASATANSCNKLHSLHGSSGHFMSPTPAMDFIDMLVLQGELSN